jgi:dienelactone hydrolase
MMKLSTLLLGLSATGAIAQFGNLLGAKMDPNTPLNSIAGLMGGAGAEAPKDKLTDAQWADPGTGQYKAKWFEDASLPNKTIYAPITPPKGVKMPVLVWSEGGCLQTGIFYAPFLLELSSHGYVILANGAPNGRSPTTVGELQKLMSLPRSKYQDLLESIKWAESPRSAKYGELDLTKIAAGGQSCGGGEAMWAASASDKVKLTVLVNSGNPMPSLGKTIASFKGPVAIFNGGPKDIAYTNVCGSRKHFTRDQQLISIAQGIAQYKNTPDNIPAYLADLDAGVCYEYWFGLNPEAN